MIIILRMDSKRAPFSVLRTKLNPAAAEAKTIIRPRLIVRLGEESPRRVALISAPAGFGKTTLLAEWVTRLDRPGAWLSLEERDSDPVRFLTYFIGALQQIDPTDMLTVVHPELGGSTYDKHPDGSGVCHVSTQRPLVHTRLRAIMAKLRETGYRK